MHARATTIHGEVDSCPSHGYAYCRLTPQWWKRRGHWGQLSLPPRLWLQVYRATETQDKPCHNVLPD